MRRKLLSVKTEGDEMILTFDKRVHPDDQSPIIEGFALAGEDAKYYKAYARHSGVGDFWTAMKTVHVWSPLVPKPVHVRYAWGNSPMGNLYVNGHQEMPLPEFRTDSWDLPESEDLTDKGLTREFPTVERRRQSPPRIPPHRGSQARPRNHRTPQNPRQTEEVTVQHPYQPQPTKIHHETPILPRSSIQRPILMSGQTNAQFPFPNPSAYNPGSHPCGTDRKR
jgi:hypothetical protein